MKKLLETIATYCPQDEGEHAVQQAMLRQLRQCPGTILGRDDLAHMTASAFVINRDASRILLLYHNQMNPMKSGDGRCRGICISPWRICCRQMTPRRCGSARRKTGR